MQSLIEAFVSPRLIDLILMFTTIEAFGLMIWRHKARLGRERVAIGVMLLPGVFLLLAIRAALAGASWPWVPVALTAALVTHLLDLRARLRK